MSENIKPKKKCEKGEDLAEFAHLDEIIRQTEQLVPFHSTNTQIGEVVETPKNKDERISVHWINENGRSINRKLLTLNNLLLKKGDCVMLNKPGNYSEWLICGVLKSSSLKKTQTVDIKGKRETINATINATVDGERVEIDGKDEIVLRCGKASITLRRNGRIVIKGAYVETRSAGTNRIKGGSVLIN